MTLKPTPAQAAKFQNFILSILDKPLNAGECLKDTIKNDDLKTLNILANVESRNSVKEFLKETSAFYASKITRVLENRIPELKKLLDVSQIMESKNLLTPHVALLNLLANTSSQELRNKDVANGSPSNAGTEVQTHSHQETEHAETIIHVLKPINESLKTIIEMQKKPLLKKVDKALEHVQAKVRENMGKVG